MKVLFLDFDGVLNSEESYVKNHEARCEAEFKYGKESYNRDEFTFPMGHLSEPLIERLNQIVEKTNCQIVVSSTWRIGHTIEELAGWLTRKGFRHGDKIIDRTDNDPTDARGGQIQRWLDAHPEVTTYVVIDDDSEDIVGSYTTKTHPNNFVHTSFKWGLQNGSVENAILILNAKRPDLHPNTVRGFDA